MTATSLTKQQLLSGRPSAVELIAETVRDARGSSAHRLVVLDDDPTGTQSVGDLTVLTGWTEEDLFWAFNTGAPAMYLDDRMGEVNAPDLLGRCSASVRRCSTTWTPTRNVTSTTF